MKETTTFIVLLVCFLAIASYTIVRIGRKQGKYASWSWWGLLVDICLGIGPLDFKLFPSSRSQNKIMRGVVNFFNQYITAVLFALYVGLSIWISFYIAFLR